MKNHQTTFIEMAIESKALCFGEYELKSGRVSPYFFNAGLLYQGKALSILGQSYAQVVIESDIEFDVIFGPAYKGISLAALTSAALYDQHGVDVPFAYNRKEKKDHGEGGQLVGGKLQGKRILIIDDVITAGTAIREVVALLDKEGATLSAVLVGLNRQEKGAGSLSAIQEIEKDYSVPVLSIIKLDDIVSYIEGRSIEADLDSIKNYRKEYGVIS